MKCQRKRMANFWSGGSIKDLWFKLFTFYISQVQIVQMFNVFKEGSKGSGLDTPPASALDLLLSLGGRLCVGTSAAADRRPAIPLHFDMLNATLYSLSKEGNLHLGRIKRFKGVTLE